MPGLSDHTPFRPKTSNRERSSVRETPCSSVSSRTSFTNPLLRRLGLFFRLLFFRLFASSFLFVRLFLRALPGLLQKFLFLLLQRRAPRQVFFAVKVNVPVNQCLLHHRVRAQRIAVINRQVRVLSHLDGPYTLLDAQLDRGVQRHQL